MGNFPHQFAQGRQTNPRLFAGNVLAFLAVLSILSLYTIQAFGIANDPARNKETDFIAFYSAGVIAQRQGYTEIYNIELQRQVQQELRNIQLSPRQVLLFNHLPLIIALLPIIPGNFTASFELWMAGLAAINLISIFILSGILPWANAWDKLLIICGGMCFLPIYTDILNGQDAALMFFGAALFFRMIINSDRQHIWREIASGAALGLLVIRPPIAVFFFLPILIWSPKAFAGFIASSAALLALSAILVGANGILGFIHMAQITASGDWFGLNEAGMANLLGLAVRILPLAPVAWLRLFAWVLFLISMIATAILFFKNKSRILYEHLFALAIPTALLTSPHVHSHELIITLISAFYLLRLLLNLQPQRAGWIFLIPAVSAFLLLLSTVIPWDRFASLYIFSALITAWLIILQKSISCMHDQGKNIIEFAGKGLYDE